jgi:hypothetical protein
MPSILPCRMSTPFWLFAAFVLWDISSWSLV